MSAYLCAYSTAADRAKMDEYRVVGYALIFLEPHVTKYLTRLVVGYLNGESLVTSIITHIQDDMTSRRQAEMRARIIDKPFDL